MDGTMRLRTLGRHLSCSRTLLSAALTGVRGVAAGAAADSASTLTCKEIVGGSTDKTVSHAMDNLNNNNLPSLFGESSFKPVPLQARTWDDVPCPEDAKEPLKAAGLGPHVGLALVRELGYSAALDLALLPDEEVQGLGGAGGAAAAVAAAAGAAGGAAGGGGGGGGGGGPGLKPLEVARLMVVCRAAREARLSPRSGALQELADILRAASTPTVVDLGGLTFSGVLRADPDQPGTGQQQLLRVSANNVTIINGHLHLRPNQALTVSGRNCVLSDLTLEAARSSAGAGGGPAAAAAAAAATPSDGGAASPSLLAAAAAGGSSVPPVQRVDVGLIAVLGGGLRITRCRVVNHCPQVAVLVAGEGRVDMWHSEVSSGGSGVLVAGLGSELRLHHCRVADTAGTCVHVGASATAFLAGSELLRSELYCGLVAQGAGTRVEARVVVLDGSRESNVFVCEGATALLQDCRITHSMDRQALQARGRGSRAQLQRCLLSLSRQSGAYVLDGAAVDMQACTVQSNGISGVMLQGSGSWARLAACKIHGNRGAGVHVYGGAQAEVDGCEVTGPAADPVQAPASSQQQPQPPGSDGATSSPPPPPPPLIKAQGEGSCVTVTATACNGEVVAADGATVVM